MRHEKTTLFLTLALAFLPAAMAFASGSSAPVSVPSGGQDPYLVTATIRCQVVKILDDGRIVIKDDGKDRERFLGYNPKTKFSAQDKTAFDGRKKLQVEDLRVGHLLKVTLRPATGEAVRVKVLKES